ncbi:MAG: hypothetical protein U5N56_00225 [Candidatus Marinimicrobia bacterium]|nr:hypothetical protein [Candidatus Neomarinimicrobiota bacterium]
MSEDYFGPKERERSMKNRVVKRGKWLSQNWKVSTNGNEMIADSGFRITIFNKYAHWNAHLLCPPRNI